MVEIRPVHHPSTLILSFLVVPGLFLSIFRLYPRPYLFVDRLKVHYRAIRFYSFYFRCPV